jgi:hypothetical protein
MCWLSREIPFALPGSRISRPFDPKTKHQYAAFFILLPLWGIALHSIQNKLKIIDSSNLNFHFNLQKKLLFCNQHRNPKWMKGTKATVWENAVAVLEGKCCIKLKMLKTFKWAHNLSHIDWLCCVRMHRFYMARCFARNKCLTRCCFVQHMHASAAAILVCVYVCV